MEHRTHRWARWMAWLVMVAAMVSCATVEAAAGEVGSGALERSIARSMQGAQLDVWGGGAPTPGRTTTVYVHRGDLAVELYWTTDGWCLARAMTWSVEDARDHSHFTVRYTAAKLHTDCLMDTGSVEELRVDGAAGSGARTSWSATWVGGREMRTVRTRCSDRWDDPAPCGFVDAFALVPSL